MARNAEDVAAGNGDQGPPPGARRVGAALRQAREERGLSLEDVGNAIRFSPRQVRALEEGRVADLPPHPFARGLVIAYAAHLGLDAKAAAGEWGRPAGEGGPGRRGILRVPLRTRSSWRDWAVPAACALGTVAAIALNALQGPMPVDMPEEGRRAGTARPAPPPPPPEPPEKRAAPQAAAATDGKLAVTLRSEGNTWIEVGVDGESSQRQALRPGENLDLRARRRLALALGDAGAVRISVNGRELGFIGDRGEVRRGIVFEAPSDAPAARDVPGAR